MLSVIVPIYNEEKYIVKCIETILAQDYPKDDLEVVFVDGMSTDRTREIVLEYVEEYDFIRLLENPKRIAPCAMNIGIRATIGEYVMRLDGHALYPTNYFSSIVQWHKKRPEIDNVGGICVTDVVNRNKESMSIAKVMSDKFGVGNSKFRTGVQDVECLEVDTVPFGCYKRGVFKKIGLYNEDLVRCQDIELNKRLKRAGGRILIVPSIYCTYIPRDNFSDFYRNRYFTGYWVVKMGFVTGTLKNSGVRHFVPAIFVMTIFLSVLLGLVNNIFFIPGMVALLLYVVLMFGRAFVINDENTSIWNLFRAFCCIHFSYGFGSLKGLYDCLLKRT